MKFQQLLPVAVAGVAIAQDDSSAQNLTAVLGANNDTLSSLGALLETQPSLVETLAGLENITILAPSNDALETFLDGGSIEDLDSDMVQALLMYHVLNGTVMSDDIEEGTPAFAHTLLMNQTYSNVTNGQVVEAMKEGENVTFVSGLGAMSNVTTADVEFTGGVIHIIDMVLRIPEGIAETASAAGLTAVVGALTEADLASSLSGLEDVTVFAPSNAAFAAIGSLSENITIEMLEGILAYHVIEGTVAYSSDLESGSTVETMGGEDVTITIEDGEVYVNSAKVIMPNVLVANGVVHVIDSVLNPNNTEAEVNPSSTVPAFDGASTASSGEIPFTSGVEAASTTATNLAPEETDNAGNKKTGAMAAGVLFGGAAVMMNL